MFECRSGFDKPYRSFLAFPPYYVRGPFVSLLANANVFVSPWFVVGASAEAASSPAPTPTPAASEPAETPAPSTFYSKKMPEKGKRKGAPILNLFKRDTGPQRATTLEEALAAEVRARRNVVVARAGYCTFGGILTMNTFTWSVVQRCVL